MKQLCVILVLLVTFVSAAQDSVAKVVNSKIEILPTTEDSESKAPTRGTTDELNQKLLFAELPLDSHYAPEALTLWESVTLPAPTRKLMMGKSITPETGLEVYGRILMQCGSILPYEFLKEKALLEVQGKCFEFSGTLFQQFEEKAGLYENNEQLFYLSTLSPPPEAVSGWVRVSDTFTYNTAMGETKSVIHLKELLLFIERSLIENE